MSDQGLQRRAFHHRTKACLWITRIQWHVDSAALPYAEHRCNEFGRALQTNANQALGLYIERLEIARELVGMRIELGKGHLSFAGNQSNR